MIAPFRWAASRAAKQIVIAMARQMKEGQLTAVFPDGRARTFGKRGGEPRATIYINDDDFFSRVLRGGEVGFGEAYQDFVWHSDDLVSLLELGVANRRHVQFNSRWLTRAARLKDLRLHRDRKNTHEGAKENIHAHYDLGNEFFRTFLDETMTYSCAYFSAPDESLADAQRAKYQRLCEKAGITASSHVLEVGCGWGGFATYTAERYGCRVTGITISQEQLAFARQRVEDAGLSDLVEVRFCDYREIDGQYDAIVSIEMFEAVGAEYFATFFESLDRALKPGGRVALQTISVPDRAFAAVRDGVNWIQKYIFPGGMLPSLAEMERAARNTQFVITTAEDIGPHYAMTLRRWRERFMSSLPAVRAQGFDERFIRTWEYYLAVSEAGFLTRNTGDLQVVLEKPAGRALPRFASEAGREPIRVEALPV